MDSKPHSRDVFIVEDALDRFAALVPGGDHRATYVEDCDACIAKDALTRLVEQLGAANLALLEEESARVEAQEQLEAAQARIQTLEKQLAGCINAHTAHLPEWLQREQASNPASEPEAS